MEERGLARATVGRRLSTVSVFYRFAVVDGLLAHSQAEFIRRPKISTGSATLGLDRMELGAFVACGAAGSPTDHALACLLGLLGLRVGGVLDRHRGPRRRAGPPHRHRARRGCQARRHPAATAHRHGPRPGHRRSAVRTALLARSGNRLNRHAATRIVRRLARTAGITKHISGHSPRHSFITIAAHHADPRTTTRYARARHNLDRHASYIVTAFIAGAS